MRIRTRTAAVVATAAVGLTAATGVAFAAGAVDLAGDDPNQPGTITVDESMLPEDDAAEQAELRELASVGAAAAGAAAIEAVGGGEVAGTELEDENGFVVWEVAVRAADGSLQEVTVDAGDASVLGTERDGDDGDDD